MDPLLGMYKDRERLQQDLRHIERDIIAYLVENQMFEFFSVNWTKIGRAKRAVDSQLEHFTK